MYKRIVVIVAAICLAAGICFAQAEDKVEQQGTSANTEQGVEPKDTQSQPAVQQENTGVQPGNESAGAQSEQETIKSKKMTANESR